MGGSAVIVTPSVGLLRPADVDVSDLTNSERIGPPYWDADGALVIPFDPEPTENEQARIRRRLLTVDAAHETEVATMQEALAALDGRTGAIAEGLRLLLNAHLTSTLGETP